MLSDGEDDVCLIVKTGGHLSIDQRGRQSVARTGDAVLLAYREPSTLRFQAMNYVALRVPFAALAPLSRKLETSAAGCIPRETAALQLLGAYLGSLPARVADPQLCNVIATHVYDLMALAIGATRDGEELASQRGLRAGRLEAIKADLTKDTELTLDDVAYRQGVSPRYVQKLFEETGTTFTAFVLERRLDAARSMLLSPRYAHWSVARVAMEASFGDLSYFNRRFKARYGQTPSDLRAQAVS
jgi:AraC-like DNA-binding protein